MTTGAYLPRWLNCLTEEGRVRALVFVINRNDSAYVRALPEAQLLTVIRQARGRYGSCTEYVVRTAHALHAAGIRDARLEALAHRLQMDQSALNET